MVKVTIVLYKRDEDKNDLVLFKKEGDYYSLPESSLPKGEMTATVAEKLVHDINGNNHKEVSLEHIIEYFENDCWIGFYYYAELPPDADPEGWIWVGVDEVLDIEKDKCKGILREYIRETGLTHSIDIHDEECYDELDGGEKDSTG